MMKVSIITVSYNCETTIEDTILSVANQDYSNKEHIVIDGGSNDKTMEFVEKHGDIIQQYISEPDNGIYDAMNKGIRLATGDVIGILNADDIYFDSTCISKVVNAFEEKGVCAICGNLVYVSPDNLNKVVRFYSSEGFHPNMFKFGMMPAHPAFFVLWKCYESFGFYKENYRIAADFELLLRFLKIHGISYHCISKTLVKMRTGGVSTRNIKSNWILNKEILKACRENNIDTNMVKILSKYFIKLPQLFKRYS
jgi:glycosyltransferase involved in cell wall biosynthesis